MFSGWKLKEHASNIKSKGEMLLTLAAQPSKHTSKKKQVSYLLLARLRHYISKYS